MTRNFIIYLKKCWKPLIFFLFIFLLASFLRLYNLSSVPPHPLHDEASNGYNAYSILKTGSDEYGAKYPLLLRAYDDWRPALFTYFSIPFISLFDLNTLSIRLPSVVLSLASIVVFYFLVEELLKENAQRKFVQIFMASSAFLFAISPWDIYLSRISNEANLSLFFLLLGIFLFFKYINNRYVWQFFISSAFFALAFDSYNAIKIFIPLFFISLLFIYYKLIQKKVLLFGIILFLITILPFIILFLTPSSSKRLADVSIFSQTPNATSKSAARLVYDNAHHDIFGKFVDNRRMDYFYTFTNNYLNNLNPLWLFTDSLQTQNTYFNIPNVGIFYLFEFPLLLYGVYISIKKTVFSKKIFATLLLWIAIGILPSAFTIDSPQANRTLQVLPTLLIFQGIGLGYLIPALLQLKSRVIRLTSLPIILLVIGFSVMWFYHAYFINFPREDSSLYEYGISQAIDYADTNQDKYEKIQFSTDYNAIRSSTYFLFKEKYNPSLYQKSGGSISGYFNQPHIIGKFYSTNPDFVDYENGKEHIHAPFYATDKIKTLYIISPNEYPQSKVKLLNSQYFKLLDDIKYLDGTDALWIITKIPQS